ncbi:TIM23 complex component [Coniosporium apollinis]|uniref:Presequence translocated-associated motor subunit PAM17 n=1 Tax=Coniosporium apollinis TaxID=61459 RepID=A0ABQ9NLE6_9PEZI|nr:TIM23 complex component [Coniosporium apollinis]
MFQTTLPLRTARVLSRQAQPLLRAPLPSATQCPFHTAVARPFQTAAPRAPSLSKQRPSLVSRTISQPAIQSLSITTSPRHASTISDPTSAAAAAPPANEHSLTWNRFLALRKTRRRISLVSSIICAGASTFLGIAVLSTKDIDAMGSQILGLDPIIVLGMSTIACTVVGWLIGPFFGNAVFNVWYRGLRRDIAWKEREFYARIKKYRVDPSSSSIQNPVPDYYGEKIGSVTDYRRWLKDQRAFNLKRGKGV